MKAPSLDQLAYRWNGGGSLPGRDNSDSTRDRAQDIIREAREQTDRRREQENAYYKKLREDAIDDD